jgi:hypothetical protein
LGKGYVLGKKKACRECNAKSHKKSSYVRTDGDKLQMEHFLFQNEIIIDKVQ